MFVSCLFMSEKLLSTRHVPVLSSLLMPMSWFKIKLSCIHIRSRVPATFRDGLKEFSIEKKLCEENWKKPVCWRFICERKKNLSILFLPQSARYFILKAFASQQKRKKIWRHRKIWNRKTFRWSVFEDSVLPPPFARASRSLVKVH